MSFLFFTVERDLITVPRESYIALHWYVFQIVYPYFNKLINYCGPQPLNLFKHVCSISVCFDFIYNANIYLLKASNLIRTPGSHIAIVSNQTFNLRTPIRSVGGVIFFIGFFYSSCICQYNKS